IQTYSTDQIILGNAADGLSICANVLAAQTQTPKPVTTPASTIITTPMPGYTPRP
ncbi:MAG: hypothetical protein IMZ50_12390, partial [Candidatus Atribacteria bacterium]|nr:hypothetical protein [Candidatus Atribacteria bacterium]